MLSIEQPVQGYKTEKHIILRCTTGISAFFHGGVSGGGALEGAIVDIANGLIN